MSFHAYRPLDADMPHLRESCDWGTDPDSGSCIIRMTTSVGMSHNIYCEQPYGSPDGRRLIFFRALDMHTRSRQLLIADLEARDTTLIEPDVPSEEVAHVSWGEWAYYPMHDGSLRRISLMSLVKEEVLPAGAITGGIGAISSDDRYLLMTEAKGDHFICSTIDMQTGDRQVLVDCPENRNPHGQLSLCKPPRLLYQLIAGDSDLQGVPVLVRELAADEPSRLPFGKPWTAESTGHMTWLADTGMVACTVTWDGEKRRHDSRHPEGNLMYAAPGDEAPSVFPAPDSWFYHISVSRCGKYFVSDDFADFQATGAIDGKPGPIRIVIGNFASGKSRALVHDCQNYGIAGCSRFEPDPYFTADNKYVIYNASPFGTIQLFAAEVPEDFRRSLD